MSKALRVGFNKAHPALVPTFISGSTRTKDFSGSQCVHTPEEERTSDKSVFQKQPPPLVCALPAPTATTPFVFVLFYFVSFCPGVLLRDLLAPWLGGCHYFPRFSLDIEKSLLINSL